MAKRVGVPMINGELRRHDDMMGERFNWMFIDKPEGKQINVCWFYWINKCGLCVCI